MLTMDRESSLTLIRMVDDLPSLPDRYARISEVIDNPQSSAADLARIVGTDQATAIMVLKFANSPAHNPMGKNIASLSMAIARLGSKETAQIAMTMSLMYGFAFPAGMVHIRAFWAHAFAVALLNKQLAALLDLDQDAYFTIGLLHDIGRAALGIRVDMNYFESQCAQLNGVELIAAEKTAFGIDHAEAGEEILKLWDFPAFIYETIGAHHCQDTSSIAARILQLADEAAHQAIPYKTNIDQIEEFLENNLEHPRLLLENAGLIAKLEPETASD